MTGIPLSPTFSANSLGPGCDVHDGAGPPDRYQALLARLRREHVPFSIVWELTHTCNLRCVMCYNVSLAEPELATAECLDILEQLAAAGTLWLTLTGGEILAHRDFFTIAARARLLGLALILKTNATLLTPERADRIAALSPAQVDVSLLGATDRTFDAVTGGHGTLSRVVRGVRLLRERGVRVKLNTLLLDLNVAERRAMGELALELGVAYEQVFKVSPADDGSYSAAGHQLSRPEMTDVLVADGTPFLPRAPGAGTRTCAVGLASCLISPHGVVYPCVELRVPAGDLRRQPFAEVWAHAPILQELRTRHTCEHLWECRECPLSRYCEGRCAGLAWKEHGDLYAGHSLACRHAQARYAQQHPSVPPPETPWQARRRQSGGGGGSARGSAAHPPPPRTRGGDQGGPPDYGPLI